MKFKNWSRIIISISRSKKKTNEREVTSRQKWTSDLLPLPQTLWYNLPRIESPWPLQDIPWNWTWMQKGNLDERHQWLWHQHFLIIIIVTWQDTVSIRWLKKQHTTVLTRQETRCRRSLPTDFRKNRGVFPSGIVFPANAGVPVLRLKKMKRPQLPQLVPQQTSIHPKYPRVPAVTCGSRCPILSKTGGLSVPPQLPVVDRSWWGNNSHTYFMSFNVN